MTGPAAEELAIAQQDCAIRCLACGHRCLVKPGKAGICKVRFNHQGQLHVPRGYVAGLAADPIEKKPFFHVLPGSQALTFGMLGCDLHCAYCQNWISSQALRDPAAVAGATAISAQRIVQLAMEHGCPTLISSYNEPLITSEWAVEIFRLAQRQGLLCAFVSNGNATPQVLDYLLPYIRAYKVDLKTFSDRCYRQLGGVLENVLQTIGGLKRRGVWVEIVTLLVPGFSDNRDDLKRMAEFLAGVDPLMPWHITAFHPDYHMSTGRATSADDLLTARQIGLDAGLCYIYTGNLPGQTGAGENTVCHHCGATVIRRRGFDIEAMGLSATGACPHCDHVLPGIWSVTP